MPASRRSSSASPPWNSESRASRVGEPARSHQAVAGHGLATASSARPYVASEPVEERREPGGDGMWSDDTKRPNYYEGQYLGPGDFQAEQQYHRDMRRRLSLGQHAWGIFV